MGKKNVLLVISLVIFFISSTFCVFVLSNRRLYSVFYRLAHPSYSSCRHCGMPWSNVEGHSTYYTEGRGCFPLCEDCWSSLTIEERLPYYKQLWSSWPIPKPDWNLIEKAVKEGK